MSLFTSLKNTLKSPLHGDNDISMEEMGRQKLFTVFFIGILVPLIAFGIKHLIAQDYIWGGSICLVALLQIAMLVSIRSRKEGRNVYRVSLILMYSLFLYWTYTGTIHGLGSIWTLGIPPYAFFLLGRREGTLWVTAIGIITAVIVFHPFSLPGGFEYPPDYSVRLLTLYLIIFMFTYTYETTREKYRDLLLAQNIDLEKIVAERTFEIHQKNIKLEESKNLHHLIENNINDLIWLGNIDFTLTYISPSVEKMLGYTQEEAMQLPFEKWYPPESFESISTFLNEKLEQYMMGQPIDRHFSIESRHLAKDGSVVEVELTLSVIMDEDNTVTAVAGITRDISERKNYQREKDKFQQRLAQSQKMEAIGTLVAGIAHDFNNFLSGIIGSYDLLKYALINEKLHYRDTIESYLTMGAASANRSADLIKQLLTISRKHDIILSPIDINDAVRHVRKLCENSLPKSIDLDFRLSREPLVVMADLVQVEQVFLNICINASHAMTVMREPGEKHGGVLTVKAEKVGPDLALETIHDNTMTMGDLWVRVLITDTGVGMSEGVLKHVFEPFFTKNKVEGSGLGLSTSYHIMEKHGGYIHAYSTPGSGSCFSLYFPIYTHSETSESPSGEVPELITGTGLVFVVDDEEIVGHVIQQFLINCGYTVIRANGAKEAIALYGERYQEIAVVILDLNLPLMSGLEIYTELKAINPDIKALLSSGLIDTETKNKALELGINDTIRKPYVAHELSLKIKDLTMPPSN